MPVPREPLPEDPRWAPARPPRRPALSRDAIVGSAVRLADAEGLAAVSMPRLARGLGAATMSLYRHVPHKEALVALMVDAALGTPPDLTGRALRDGLAAWAHALREVFAAHPWVLPRLGGDRRMGPGECAWAEAVLALVVARGGRVADAVGTLHLVHSYVRGAAAVAGDRLPSGPDLTGTGRDAGLPTLTRLLTDPDAAGDAPAGPLFDTGLARVLDAAVGVPARSGGRVEPSPGCAASRRARPADAAITGGADRSR